MPEYIYVLGMDGKPQMPTTRRRHVQKLLDTGKARIAESVPFTIQLLYDNDPVLQPVTLAEDPGRTNIGLAILECDEAAKDIKDGDEVEVDFDSGVISNITTGKTYQAQPFPPFIQNIIKNGGLMNSIK